MLTIYIIIDRDYNKSEKYRQVIENLCVDHDHL